MLSAVSHVDPGTCWIQLRSSWALKNAAWMPPNMWIVP